MASKGALSVQLREIEVAEQLFETISRRLFRKSTL